MSLHHSRSDMKGSSHAPAMGKFNEDEISNSFLQRFNKTLQSSLEKKELGGTGLASPAPISENALSSSPSHEATTPQSFQSCSRKNESPESVNRGGTESVIGESLPFQFDPTNMSAQEIQIEAIFFKYSAELYITSVYPGASQQSQASAMLECLKGSAFREALYECRGYPARSLFKSMAAFSRWFEKRYCFPGGYFDMYQHFERLYRLRSRKEYVEEFSRLVTVNRMLENPIDKVSDAIMNNYFIRGIRDPQIRLVLSFSIAERDFTKRLDKSIDFVRFLTKDDACPMMWTDEHS